MLINEFTLFCVLFCSLALCLALGFYISKQHSKKESKYYFHNSLLLSCIIYSLFLIYFFYMIDITKICSFSLYYIYNGLSFMIIFVYPFLILYLISKEEKELLLSKANANVDERKKLKEEPNDDESDSMVDMKESYYNDYLSEYDEDYELDYIENYSYYLVITVVLELILYILYKVRLFSSYKNILENSLKLPKEYHRFLTIKDFFEIMAYVNYEVIIGLLAKLLLVVYIPYGFVQLIVAQCSNILAFFKDSQKRKKERVIKDEPVIKEKKNEEYEIVKVLLNQMRIGKPLTKKEKNILSQYYSKQKDNKVNNIINTETKINLITSLINYLSFIIHLILLLISILCVLVILLSQGSLFYSQLFDNYCGYECGWMLKDYSFKYSLQGIYSSLTKHHYGFFLFPFMLIVFVFIYYKAFKQSLSVIGFFINIGEDNNNRTHSQRAITYCILCFLFIGILFEITNMIPFTNSQLKYDISSQYTLFDITYRLNFTLIKYFDLFYEISFIVVFQIIFCYKIFVLIF